jgi:hypothetical protein
MIDGSAHLRLVPHINWNSMYAGKTITTYDHTTRRTTAFGLHENESPVNLFKVDFDEYPKVKFVAQTYAEFLAPGDCLYVPAFYWY